MNYFKGTAYMVPAYNTYIWPASSIHVEFSKSTDQAMGVVAKQGSRNALILFLGFGLGGLVTLLGPRVFSDDASQWGLIQILVSYSAIFSLFVTFGVGNIVLRFLPIYKKENDENRVYSLALWLPVTGLILLGIVLAFFPNQFLGLINEATREQLTPYLPHLFFLVLIFSYNKVFVGILMALVRTVINNVMNEVGIRLLALTGLSLLFFGWLQFEDLVLWYVGAYALVAGVLMFDALRNIKIKTLLVPIRKYHDMIVFGFYSLLDSGISIFISRADILMIAYFLQADFVGIYTGGFYLGTLVELAHRAITVVAAPLIAQAWNDNRMDEVKKLYRQTSLNLTLFGGAVCMLILINSADVVYIFPEAYRGIQWVVVFIGLTKFVSVVFSLNGYIIGVSPDFRYNFYFNLVLVVITVLSNLWLIPLYGIDGAALATLISMIMFNAMRFIFLLVKYNIQPLSWNHLIAVTILSFSGGMAVLFDPSQWDVTWLLNIRDMLPGAIHFLWNMALRSLVAMIFFVPLVLAIKPSPEFHRFLVGMVNKIKP